MLTNEEINRLLSRKQKVRFHVEFEVPALMTDTDDLIAVSEEIANFARRMSVKHFHRIQPVSHGWARKGRRF